VENRSHNFSVVALLGLASTILLFVAIQKFVGMCSVGTAALIFAPLLLPVGVAISCFRAKRFLAGGIWLLLVIFTVIAVTGFAQKGLEDMRCVSGFDPDDIKKALQPNE